MREHVKYPATREAILAACLAVTGPCIAAGPRQDRLDVPLEIDRQPALAVDYLERRLGLQRADGCDHRAGSVRRHPDGALQPHRRPDDLDDHGSGPRAVRPRAGPLALDQ